MPPDQKRPDGLADALASVHMAESDPVQAAIVIAEMRDGIRGAYAVIRALLRHMTVAEVMLPQGPLWAEGPVSVEQVVDKRGRSLGVVVKLEAIRDAADEGASGPGDLPGVPEAASASAPPAAP